jgi:Glycosyl hydrolases family 16
VLAVALGLGAVLLWLELTDGAATPTQRVLPGPPVAPTAPAEDESTSSELSLAPSPVFVDDADADRVTVLGSWASRSGAKGSYGDTLLHDNNGGKGAKSVRFTPLLPEARMYNVYLRWPEDPRHASNTPIIVTHAAGTTSVVVDQRIGGGGWNHVGRYRFDAGRRGSVLISNTGTGGTVVADAVIFAPTLNVQALPLTFSEEFSEPLDVSSYDNWQRAPSKWFASTPYSTDGYGDAKFGGAGDPPLSLAKGVLAIRASKTENGWVSGMLSSARPDGSGFLQRYGYFEARMKFPAGMGTWPSFWMLGAGSLSRRGNKYAEIDVVEFYGNQPDTAYAATHVWAEIGREEPGGTLQASVVRGLSETFHTYGVLVRDAFTTWYIDGVPQYQTPTLPESKEPLYMMVCYALGGDWPLYGVGNPSFAEVDYVRAYAVSP